MGIMDLLNLSSKEKDTHAPAPIPERIRKDAKVLMITGDKVEDIEFFYPYYRLTEEGYVVDVATEKGGKFEGKHGLGLKNTKSVDNVNAEDYALLYLPGGKAPEALRENSRVLSLVKEFGHNGKPVAAICHGPQILITAGLVQGKRVAAWPELRDEIEEAGVIFVDEALVIDGQYITARMPGDLPRHLAGVLEALRNVAKLRKSTKPFAA